MSSYGKENNRTGNKFYFKNTLHRKRNILGSRVIANFGIRHMKKILNAVVVDSSHTSKTSK